MGSPLERLLVILDYDGTVTVDDCNEVVLQQAVGDAWRGSELAMQRGEISPGEAFRRQIGLLRLPRHELFELAVASSRLRPGFHEFLDGVLAGGARVMVVSDGLRETIEAVWAREGLPPIDLHASELLGDPETGYDVGFNALALECDRCQHCKGHVLGSVRRPQERVAVFGDGDGDYCLAREAELVFARRRLAMLCARDGIAFRPFETFKGVLEQLADAI